MLAQRHSSLLHWRGSTVALTPAPARAYVYLIHFERPLAYQIKQKNQVAHYAAHYIGSCVCIDRRMHEHSSGSGAAILRHCNQIGVAWHIERLWQFDSSEEARLFEKKLKRASHGPRYCPACNPRLDADPLVFSRRGHQKLARPIGKRRPMRGGRAPRFVVR